MLGSLLAFCIDKPCRLLPSFKVFKNFKAWRKSHCLAGCGSFVQQTGEGDRKSLTVMRQLQVVLAFRRGLLYRLFSIFGDSRRLLAIAQTLYPLQREKCRVFWALQIDAPILAFPAYHPNRNQPTTHQVLPIPQDLSTLT